jgi:hypothetical protein
LATCACRSARSVVVARGSIDARAAYMDTDVVSPLVAALLLPSDPPMRFVMVVARGGARGGWVAGGFQARVQTGEDAA